MIFLLLTMVILISLLIIGSVFANHITAVVQQYLPGYGDEGEQLVLWSGMVLAAFVTGLLIMYLLLRL